MTDLQRRALARVPMTEAEIETAYKRGCHPSGYDTRRICESHERLRAELQGVTLLLAEDAEKVASREAETRLLRISQLEQALKRCAEVCANHDDYSPQEACRKVIDTAKGMGVVS